MEARTAAAKGNGGLSLSMRIIGTFFVAMAITTGTALASSFAVIGQAAPQALPSILTIDQPTPAKVVARSSIDKPADQSKQADADVKQAQRLLHPSSEPASADKLETPSIMALGEPAPAVTLEKVAAIPNKPKRGPMFKPLVIRGGVAGDAFAPATHAASSSTAADTSEHTSDEEDPSFSDTASSEHDDTSSAHVPKGIPQ